MHEITRYIPDIEGVGVPVEGTLHLNSCLMTYPYTMELKRVIERACSKRKTAKFFVFDRHGKKVDETYTLEEILAKYTAWKPDYVDSL